MEGYRRMLNMVCNYGVFDPLTMFRIHTEQGQSKAATAN
jgi:hypothetical protein